MYSYKTRDHRCRLEKGDLYIRSISKPVESRKIRTNEEWNELLLRLLSKKEKIVYNDLQKICANAQFGEKKIKPKKKN